MALNSRDATIRAAICSIRGSILGRNGVDCSNKAGRACSAITCFSTCRLRNLRPAFGTISVVPVKTCRLR
jgi:hypothetical protein